MLGVYDFDLAKMAGAEADGEVRWNAEDAFSPL